MNTLEISLVQTRQCHEQLFRNVRCRYCDRRCAFARPNADFMTGATLSKGQVQISWQAQRLGLVRYEPRCSAELSEGRTKNKRKRDKKRTKERQRAREKEREKRRDRAKQKLTLFYPGPTQPLLFCLFGSPQMRACHFGIGNP